MTAYDELPVGTVLRCTDGEFIGTIVARDEYGWTSAGADGRCLPSDFGDAWVELVEKPAGPAPGPERARGRDGELWQRRGRLYHLPTCADTCPLGVTYESLVRHYGPLTEVTDGAPYPAGACRGCGAPNLGDCSAHLSDCASYQALTAAEATEAGRG